MGLLKRFLVFGCVFGLLMLPMAAMAGDTISPTSFSASISVGGTTSVDKKVDVSAGTSAVSADIFFLADTTGSMYGALSSVQSGASTIMSTVSSTGALYFGAGEYKDIGDAYEYKLNQTLTQVPPNGASVQSAVSSWSAAGGGDYPESGLQALKLAATGAGWTAGAAKFIVWFGDAPSHDPAGSSGTTLAQAEAALTGAGIHVIAINESGLDDYGQATAITAATGGALYNSTYSGVAAEIEAALGTAFSTYSSVGLDLSEVPAGLLASYGGPDTGSWDRSIEHDFDLKNLTFTGVTPGEYKFNVYATVDGGRVATEAEDIIVGGGGKVPEPATMILLGLGLLGLAGVRRKL